jgi:hypothetical protein
MRNDLLKIVINMHKKPKLTDYNRKIKILFYPMREKELDQIKTKFNLNYFELSATSILEDIDLDYNLVDLIVFDERIILLSKKLNIKSIKVDFDEITSKEANIIREKAYLKYVEMIKKQIDDLVSEEKLDTLLNIFDYKNVALTDHIKRVIKNVDILSKYYNLEANELKATILFSYLGFLTFPSSLFLPKEKYTKEETQYLSKYYDISKYLSKSKTIKENIDNIKRKNQALETQLLLFSKNYDLLKNTIFYEIRHNHEETKTYLIKKHKKLGLNLEFIEEFCKILKNNLTEEEILNISMKNM